MQNGSCTGAGTLQEALLSRHNVSDSKGIRRPHWYRTEDGQRAMPKSQTKKLASEVYISTFQGLEAKWGNKERAADHEAMAKGIIPVIKRKKQAKKEPLKKAELQADLREWADCVADADRADYLESIATSKVDALRVLWDQQSVASGSTEEELSARHDAHIEKRPAKPRKETGST